MRLWKILLTFSYGQLIPLILAASVIESSTVNLGFKTPWKKANYADLHSNSTSNDILHVKHAILAKLAQFLVEENFDLVQQYIDHFTSINLEPPTLNLILKLRKEIKCNGQNCYYDSVIKTQNIKLAPDAAHDVLEYDDSRHFQESAANANTVKRPSDDRTTKGVIKKAEPEADLDYKNIKEISLIDLEDRNIRDAIPAVHDSNKTQVNEDECAADDVDCIETNSNKSSVDKQANESGNTTADTRHQTDVFNSHHHIPISESKFYQYVAKGENADSSAVVLLEKSVQPVKNYTGEISLKKSPNQNTIDEIIHEQQHTVDNLDYINVEDISDDTILIINPDYPSSKTLEDVNNKNDESENKTAAPLILTPVIAAASIAAFGIVGAAFLVKNSKLSFDRFRSFKSDNDLANNTTTDMNVSDTNVLQRDTLNDLNLNDLI